MAKKVISLIVSLVCVLIVSACASHFHSTSSSELWTLDSLTQINGHPVEKLGEPTVVKKSVENLESFNLFEHLHSFVSFDGDGDRLLVDNNPLADASEFTVEIIFKPNDVFPKNNEPRLFHLESVDNPSRRITIELRLNDQHQWYLDAFIKSDNSQFTLIDTTKVHPIGEWAHAAITYKNREFVSYVNGIKELTGGVDYLTIPTNAKASIGSRMNKIHWFNGAIAQVRFNKKALEPTQFLLPAKTLRSTHP